MPVMSWCATERSCHNYRMSEVRYVTDGGLETELIFGDGMELPLFAAFPMVEDDEGRDRLARYYGEYMRIAEEAGMSFVAESPTWRANADWGSRLGYDAKDLVRVNTLAISFLTELMAASPLEDTKVSGCLGPRGDGYRPDLTMSAAEARRYHAPQVDAFADAGADAVTALTLTHVGEAAGIALAAEAAGIPAVISFTVETDGRLPDGTPLGQAIEAVDDATHGSVAMFMVNCAHPDHLSRALESEVPWTARLGGVRGNASRMSHAELDEATELDAGDPDDFGASHLPLRDALANVEVLGGCCGTDARHVRALVSAWGTPQHTTRRD